MELAFARLLAKPAVASVIAGATSPEQLRQNASTAGWQFDPDEIAEVGHITSRGATV